VVAVTGNQDARRFSAATTASAGKNVDRACFMRATYMVAGGTTMPDQTGFLTRRSVRLIRPPLGQRWRGAGQDAVDPMEGEPAFAAEHDRIT
jgi:hypothetical protein